MDSDEINPYAAPSVIEAPVADVASDATGKYGAYRDNRKLAAWLIGLLVFGIVFNLLRGGLNLAYTLTDLGADEKRVTLIEGIMGGIGKVLIGCMIVFGTWIVRSAKNAWLFAEVSRFRSRQDFQVQQAFLHDTPGWAVGWFFIPIGNLWKPYVAMRDIVHASTVREGLPAFLLPTWWTLWIVSLVSGNFTGLLNEPSWEWNLGIQAAAWAGISGIKVALHVVALVLVRAVTTLQTDTAAALAEADVSEPGPPGLA
jgi:hypothetical protein